MSLPEGFSLRPARDEDAERVAGLVNEEAVAHLGTPIWSTEQVLRHWSNPIVDRERDVAVFLGLPLSSAEAPLVPA